MRFPKAHAGVKLLYIAELLSLAVAAIDLCFTAVTMLPDTGSATLTTLRSGVLLGLPAAKAAAGLPCLALLFVGLATAKGDEPRFGTALGFQIASCVLVMATVLGMFFAMLLDTDFYVSPPEVSSVYFSVYGVVSAVLSACVMIFIASGVVNLAGKLGDGAMIASGRRVQRVVAAFYAVSAVLDEVAGRVPGPAAAYDRITALNYLVSCVRIPIIIAFLGRAKRMLARPAAPLDPPIYPRPQPPACPPTPQPPAPESELPAPESEADA